MTEHERALADFRLEIRSYSAQIDQEIKDNNERRSRQKLEDERDEELRKKREQHRQKEEARHATEKIAEADQIAHQAAARAQALQAQIALQRRVPDADACKYFGLKANGQLAQELFNRDPQEFARLRKVASDMRTATERKQNIRR